MVKRLITLLTINDGVLFRQKILNQIIDTQLILLIIVLLMK